MAVAREVIGDQVTAVTAAGRSVPEWEIEEAREFCREKGIRHIVFSFDELEVDGFADNPPDRCYHCKTAILQKVREAAEQVDTMYIAEGSNVDDDGDYRPGKRAVQEAGVISPLKEVGLTKAEIRQLSKEMGLATWDKPSFACLASRFAYEEPITAEKLRMVELAEKFLREHGFSQYRVRMHGSMARVEVLPEDLEAETGLYRTYEGPGIHLHSSGLGRIPDREHECHLKIENVESKMRPVAALQKEEGNRHE